MDKLIIGLCVGFLAWVMFALYPTENRMVEYCTDKYYGKNVNKIDLNIKLTYSGYANLFKECERELIDNPKFFKTKYKSDTLKEQANKWETDIGNFFN